jgi:hypothetical protein
MTKNFPTFRAFLLRFLLMITCITVGLSAITKCEAQSIVGKWKGVSVINYYGAEYAKQIGKSMEEKSAQEIGNSEMAFISDHSFVVTFSAPNSTEETIMKGTWDVTGDQLKLTLEPKFNPKKIATTATFSIKGNTMVTTAIFPPDSRIVKTISTGTRL